MEEIRSKVRNIVLAITGFIVVLLSIRFVLVLLGVEASNDLIKIVFSVTYFFVQPFVNIDEILGSSSSFEVSTIVAIVCTLVMGLLFAELITAFLYDKLSDIVLNVVDALFKLMEFILICRILLKIFGISENTSPLIAQIYRTTDWTSGSLVSPKIFNGEIDLSAIVALIIIVVIDLFTETVVHNFQLRREKIKAAKAASKQSQPAQTTVNVQAPVAPPQPITQNPQHITINVPVPVQQNMPSSRQIINVVPPTSQKIVPKTVLNPQINSVNAKSSRKVGWFKRINS